MKIVATDLDGVLAAITLGDDSAGDLIVDPPPLPEESRPAQIEQLAQSARVFAKGRGNRAVGFSWTVSRQHADAATAKAFVNAHAKLVPINASLAVDTVATWSSGVITKVTAVEWYGIASTFRYTVEGATPV